jgi:CrcB protein
VVKAEARAVPTAPKAVLKERWHSTLASAKSTASWLSEPYGGLMQPTGRPSDLRIAAAVAVGGVLGSLARWALVLVLPWNPPALPTATLIANLAGCLLIGILLTWWTEGTPPAWWVRPFGAVGFVGGFTTFSAFAVEGVRLMDTGAVQLAVYYTVGSVACGLLLVHLGSYGTRRALAANPGGHR